MRILDKIATNERTIEERERKETAETNRHRSMYIVVLLVLEKERMRRRKKSTFGKCKFPGMPQMITKMRCTVSVAL